MNHKHNMSLVFLIALLTLCLVKIPAQGAELLDNCGVQIDWHETPSGLAYSPTGSVQVESVAGAGNSNLVFHFEPGSGASDCEETVPSLLVMNWEGDDLAEIEINGASFLFSSAVALQMDTATDNMYLMVLNGVAQVDNTTLQPAHLTQILLDDAGSTARGVWVGNRPIRNEEADTFEFARSMLPTVAPTTCTPRTDWLTYQVQTGDTLSAIARSINHDLAVLVTANCIANPNMIVAGQDLYVPTMPVNVQRFLPPTPEPPVEPPSIDTSHHSQSTSGDGDSDRRDHDEPKDSQEDDDDDRDEGPEDPGGTEDPGDGESVDPGIAARGEYSGGNYETTRANDSADNQAQQCPVPVGGEKPDNSCRVDDTSNPNLRGRGDSNQTGKDRVAG